MSHSNFSLSNMNSMYKNRYQKWGRSHQTLGWFKGKQEMRFSNLLQNFNLNGISITDIGCGFGDLIYYLNHYSSNFQYLGIEYVHEFINDAKSIHSKNYIQFMEGDYLQLDIPQTDISIGSGIFNYKLQKSDNYKYIEMIIEKSFKSSRLGVAFDFLSTNVDFRKYEFSFHSDPCQILRIAYKYSKNIILKNDYAPFEFTIIIFKDDSFDGNDTIFKKYKQDVTMNTVGELF